MVECGDMTPKELKTRTKAFALRSLKVADALPKSISGRTIAYQIARSGTSVASNYRAVCRAKSRADFISKVATVQEEADETGLWLELAVDSGALPKHKVEKLLQEAEELIAIFAASHITATQRRSESKGRAHNQQSATSNQQ